MIYVSGNLGMDVNGTLLTGIVNQTRQAFDNIGFILGEAQSSFRHSGLTKKCVTTFKYYYTQICHTCLFAVVKVTVLLSDLNNYDAMNVVYAECIPQNTTIHTS